jgi:hypothetical protein
LFFDDVRLEDGRALDYKFRKWVDSAPGRW